MSDKFIELQDEDIAEFKTEAEESLDSSEHHLLSFDQGSFSKESYDAIFRAFHSIKGAAGMLGMTALQNHFHHLETQFQSCKETRILSKDQVSYFLRGIDKAREILNKGNPDFDYTFPSGEQNSPQSKPAQQQTKTIPADEDITTAVVIDDEQDIVDLITALLKRAKVQAVGFTDGHKALEEIKKNTPNFVITDFKMPTMTGMDVLKQVSALEKDIPVIFLSAFLTKELLIEAISMGVFGILEKPYHDGQVITMCMNAAKKSKLTRLLNRSINFIMYQLTDLEQYLEKSGQLEVKSHLQKELRSILNARRELKKISK